MTRTAAPRRGFDLIQVIIVLVIIAILATVVIPRFASVIFGARQSSYEQTGYAYEKEVRALAAFDDADPRNLNYVVDVNQDLNGPHGLRGTAATSLYTGPGGSYWVMTGDLVFLYDTDSAANTGGDDARWVCLDFSSDPAVPATVVAGTAASGTQLATWISAWLYTTTAGTDRVCPPGS